MVASLDLLDTLTSFLHMPLFNGVIVFLLVNAMCKICSSMLLLQSYLPSDNSSHCAGLIARRKY